MDWSLAGAVILSGLAIVFLILIILIACVSIVGRAINPKAFEKKTVPPKASPSTAPTAAPAAAPSAAPVVEGGISGETVAVISAAVAAMMDDQAPGTAYSVQSIHRARQARPVWGFAGMQQNTRPF